MDTHLYNTVINLYVKRKMHTKMLNTEILNNAAPPPAITQNNGHPSTPFPQSTQPNHPFIPQEQDMHQDHQQAETNNHSSSTTTTPTTIITAAPPLPPRSSLMQSSTAVAAAVSPSQPPLAVDLSQGPGDVSLPGEPSLHTHSSKFPIEREVIVKNSRDKQCKIPNLSDYMRRAKPSIAPDAPPKQLAWTQQKNETNDSQMGFAQDIAAHQVYKAQPLLMDAGKDEPSPIRPLNSQETPVLVTSTPETEGARALPQRTYQSIKDMISSRFTKHQPPQQQHTTSSSSTSHQPPPSTPQQQTNGGSSALETSLSPQSQLRQHGVYIGPPPATTSLQQQQKQQHGATALPPSHHHVEMREMRQSHQQQQRLYEQQQRHRFQQQQTTPSGYSYYQQVSYQQPPNHQYQTYNNVDGNVSKSQSVDNVLGPSYPYSNGIDGSSKSYSQENVMSTPYGVPPHSRPPIGQQFRSGKNPMPPPPPTVASRFPPPTTTSTPLYSNQEYQQTCAATVHAPQEGLSQQGGGAIEGKNQRGEHAFRDTAASLAGPSLSKQEDDDEGGFVKRGGQSGDSGRGSTVYSSAKTSAEDATPPITGEVQEWTDRVETELRQILENGGEDVSGVGGGGGGGGGVNGVTLGAGGGTGGSTESFSSVSPPLPPLSPHSSDETFRRPRIGGGYAGKMWSSRSKDKSRSHKHGKSNENNSSDDDDYTDTRAIRKQLESLETMYAQVLKMLGVKRPNHLRYEASDPRVNKRRPCGGSISSVPSSVSSRPVRFSDRRARAAKVKDIKGINKRFQRLESHVVTLARSVAHLSSEMRTQHVMMQEMEMMRGELAALRIQTNATQQQQCQTNTMVGNHMLNVTGGGRNNHPLMAGGGGHAINSTPEKVKRLTKFFGDEPPLLRLFLRRLGYEKYAGLFEKERIGLLELPFMTEERLHKLGIPLGPRLRILQQAHVAVNPNTLCVL